LAAILVLRKRLGYPEHAMHPNSMVLTLTGAASCGSAGSASTGAAVWRAARLPPPPLPPRSARPPRGLSWILCEWFHRGKPTALVWLRHRRRPGRGHAASAISILGGCIIGFISGIVCYISVCLKPSSSTTTRWTPSACTRRGFLGAVLTGVFCYQWNFVEGVGKPGLIARVKWPGVDSAEGRHAVRRVRVRGQLCPDEDRRSGDRFIADEREEIEGLDRSEHGETGFDFGYGYEVAPLTEPAMPPPPSCRRSAAAASSRGGGVNNGDLIHAWSQMCQPTASPARSSRRSIRM